MTDDYPTLTIEHDDFPELREPVAKICENFPGEYWRKLEDQPLGDRHPTEFVDALLESGFLAAAIPEEHGGVGLPLRASSVIVETIHACGGNASACVGQLFAPIILTRHGSDTQKQLLLPKIASGELSFHAIAVAEAEAGSDATSTETSARLDGDSYIVNGCKSWVGRAEHSDLMFLLARTSPADEGGSPGSGLSAFIVDVNAAKQAGGLSMQPIGALINDNAAEVEFSNVKIPATSLLGELGKGHDYVEELADAECILYNASAVGDIKFFLDRAVEYAKERVVFGKSIAHYQGIQFPLSKAYAEGQAARLYGLKACALYDAGLPCRSEARLAKHIGAEAAWAAADACFTTHGGFAFAREYNIERKWRDARVLRLAPHSTNILLSHVATQRLGLPSVS